MTLNRKEGRWEYLPLRVRLSTVVAKLRALGFRAWVLLLSATVWANTYLIVPARYRVLHYLFGGQFWEDARWMLREVAKGMGPLGAAVLIVVVGVPAVVVAGAGIGLVLLTLLCVEGLGVLAELALERYGLE
jgi:hypothetical protein